MTHPQNHQPGAAVVTDPHQARLGTPAWIRGRARPSLASAEAPLVLLCGFLVALDLGPALLLRIWMLASLVLAAGLIGAWALQILREL